MHVDWIKTTDHSKRKHSDAKPNSPITDTDPSVVMDVKGPTTEGGPKVDIYGSSNCEAFAQRDMARKRVNREVAVNGNICDLPGHDPANRTLQPIATPGSSSTIGMRRSGAGTKTHTMSFENRMQSLTILHQRKKSSLPQIRLSL